MTDSGKRKIGKYELLGEIRNGGMASVYLAVDRKRKKQWAIKEAHKSYCRLEEQKEDISGALAEGELMKRLNHPLIPRVEEVLIENDTVYIVMEYLSGRTLDNALHTNGPFPSLQVIQIGIQLCDVLEYLHTFDPKIIYRDLKPANIMLQNDDPVSIKLFDFGIAVAAKDCENETFPPVGTIGFAAPEQYDPHKNIGEYSDVFGLGATLYNLSTGHVLAETTPGGMSLEPDSVLKKVILKCTETDPRNRYNDCKEVRSALEEALTADEMDKEANLSAVPSGDRAKCANGQLNQTLDLGVTAPLGSIIAEPTLTLAEVKRELGFCPDRTILGAATEERI